MHEILSSFYTWFVSGLTSGVILTRIIELAWSRFTQNSDRVREKKDAIGQEFNKIYLEGKGHGFTKPPQDQDNIRKVILDIDKYDKGLSNKLAQCKFLWVSSAMMVYKTPGQVLQFNSETLRHYQELRRKAEKLADDVYEVIKNKWII